MHLPNGEQAIIDRRKIVDYCLCPEHDDGQHKAHLFSSLVGLTTENAQELVEALRIAAATREAEVGKCDQYGQRYMIDLKLTGPAGSAMVRSAWIILKDEVVPRLVTCYIL